MKNNASDDLQYGINEACIYFYKDKVKLNEDVKETHAEQKLNIKHMTPTIMIGIGYLIAKGLLYYRGNHYYRINDEGVDYFESLIKNYCISRNL